MPTEEEIANWRGQNVVGNDGSKLGKIEDIYLDEDTGKPEWLAVKTGMFSGHVSFIPLAEANGNEDPIQVPYSKEQVKDAPHAEPDGALSQQEEAALYRHYGLNYSESASDSGLPTTGAPAPSPDPTPHGSPGVVGNDVSGPETDDAMTRSEEELRVGTRQQETGRVRLRKYIVTENVTKTVPVSREEVRIEREPITDANRDAATSGADLSEEEHEVTLHAETPVVEKNVVAKERVRLDKDTVTEDVQVQEGVRKEVIEQVDGEGAPPTGIDGEHGTDGGIDR
jgi:uncharacterized protein (TIGR02271 family)